MNPRILILDLETAPAKVYTWGLFDQNIGTNQIVDDGYVLCWCAKYLGDKNVLSDALINYPDYYKKNPRCDKKIAESLWKLMNEADIIVTHNGQSFDIPWANTLFCKHGLKPVSPFKNVDTYLAVRKKFRFISNKLDFICRKLDVGHKLSTGGFELWEKCMRGEKKAWKHMVQYCKHDVKLLEKLYLIIRPYVHGHPNVNLYRGVVGEVCPNCGEKELERRGFEYTSQCKYQRYVCKACGRWSRGKKPEAKTTITGI